MSAREAAPSRTVPRWLALLLQVSVSVGLLVALIAIVDWTLLKEAASALSGHALAVAAVICFASQAALVLRWRALLDMLGIRESWARSWHSVFAGLFLTNFLPGTLGSDGLRVVLLTRTCGRASTAIGAIAYERLMQLALHIGLISLAAVAPIPWLEVWVRLVIAMAGTVAVLALIFILYWLDKRPAEDAADGIRMLSAAWRLLATILVETGRMQTRMRRHRRAALAFWGASLINVAMIFALFAIVLADMGYHASIFGIMFSASGSAIATAIPISLNGVGVYEATLVILLGLAGVPLVVGLVAALVIRCIVLLVSLVGLPSVVLLWRLRGSQLRLKP